MAFSPERQFIFIPQKDLTQTFIVKMTPKKIYDGRFSQDKFNALVDAATSAQLFPGPGYKLVRHVGGTTLDIKQVSSTASIKSLQLIDASDETTKRIRIVYGIIMNGAPDGMNEGDDPPYIVNVSGTGKFYAKIVIDEMGAVTENSIVNLGSAPDDEEYTYYTEIGSYSVDGDSLNIAQSQFGPIHAAVVRNYFATSSDTERYFLLWGSTGFIG